MTCSDTAKRIGKWRQIWPFWLVMALHGAALLIFTRGFLLTRTELPYYSNCSDVSNSSCLSPPSPNLNGTINPPHQSCWTKPAVDRLVIIVLDAIRFDFLAPSTFFQESKPWMDKLRVLQKLASGKGSNSRIFKAIADPPTTSLQRLKGLTTGGLPTFIDVGNSFGAPAIVEDNLLFQMVQNGKRVVMMGDDTWVQLFPHHFEKSYPFPSFNVKDLDTVDNGCIEHLIPSLYQEDWDVLIAHFLGVDHAGHIFGVDSIPMIEKLEQYNSVLEKVIKVLESQSGPGGLHENTFLLVMGDHGQTMNGDHGGGSAEEVETSIFAMGFKQPPSSIPPELDTSSCELDLVLMGRRRVLALSNNLILQQLFQRCLVSLFLMEGAVIGHVNPELYALGAGTWNFESTNSDKCPNQSRVEEWMKNYVNVLCINSWQVKRYIDVYSASSVIGFSSEDMLRIADLYAQAEDNWSQTVKNVLLQKEGNCDPSLPVIKTQIDAYFNFLSSVAELARSKWTEFNLKMMGFGFGIMLVSLIVHVLAIKWINKQYGFSISTSQDSPLSFGLLSAFSIMAIRACSLLSNSYILEEGKVANFLLATTAIVKLRYSVMKKKMLLEAGSFLLLISVIRFTIEVGLSKQAATSQFLSKSHSWTFASSVGHSVWMYAAEIVPVSTLVLLAYILYKSIGSRSSGGILKCVIIGTILSYLLVVVYWVSESDILKVALVSGDTERNYIPRIVYAIGIGQLLLLISGQLFNGFKSLDCQKSLCIKTVGMLSAWSSTVIVLLGKQGPLVVLASIIGGYCIIKLENIEVDGNKGTTGSLNPLSVTQWHLLAVCLFFSSGHWCAFDGLRYGAAFIGFDEFILIRQAILLTIDTFGLSHILAIFGLPFLVACRYLSSKHKNQALYMQLSRVYLMYGLIVSTTVTFTLLCVTIQRRHLMVWGLFAPKFVFDVVGLVLTDLLICLASLYYFGRVEDNTVPNHS